MLIHGVTEPLELERTIWRLSDPSKQGQLEQVVQGFVESGFEYLQGLRINTQPEQPAPVFDPPCSKKILLTFKWNLLSFSLNGFRG